MDGLESEDDIRTIVVKQLWLYRYEYQPDLSDRLLDLEAFSYKFAPPFLKSCRALILVFGFWLRMRSYTEDLPAASLG